MAWARFDDRYDDNRKIKKAWRDNKASVGLHAMAITYCARHQTDGLVDVEWLIEKLPSDEERDAVIATLVAARMFEPVNGGEMFEVHDYLEFNPSSAKLSEKRDADARRKRAQRNPEPERSPNGRTSDVRSDVGRRP